MVQLDPPQQWQRVAVVGESHSLAGRLTAPGAPKNAACPNRSATPCSAVNVAVVSRRQTARDPAMDSISAGNRANRMLCTPWKRRARDRMATERRAERSRSHATNDLHFNGGSSPDSWASVLQVRERIPLLPAMYLTP